VLRAHADAILARLASAAPALTVYDTKVDDADGIPPTPYLLVIFDGVPETVDRLSGVQWSGMCRVQASAVGVSRREVQWAAEKARTALKGWVPVVTGRICAPVRRAASDGIFPDNDVTPPVLVGVDRYEFLTLEA
jgi:hypothetical protein